MAQRPKIVDLTRSYVPGDPNAFPENMMYTIQEDNPEKTIPILPYEGYNFLPTSYGYKSFFGLNSTLETDNPLPSDCDTVLLFQTAEFENIIVALCADGIYTFSSSGTDWVHQVTLTNNYVDSQQYDLWTYTVIENDLYCYRQANTIVNKLEFTDGTWSLITPSFLNMAGQIGIFRANSRLGFWDSVNSISWSSNFDLSDLEPSIKTLAGNTIFDSIVGRIVTVKENGDGFVIYCTKSIVPIAYTTVGSLIWSAIPTSNKTGVAIPGNVTIGLTDRDHYAYTSSGLMHLGAYNALTKSFAFDPIGVELMDFLRESRNPVYLDCVVGRYLYLSLVPDDTSTNKNNYIDGIVSFTTVVYPEVRDVFYIDGEVWDGDVTILPVHITGYQLSTIITQIGTGNIATQGINTATTARRTEIYYAPNWSVRLEKLSNQYRSYWNRLDPAVSGQPIYTDVDDYIDRFNNGFDTVYTGQTQQDMFDHVIPYLFNYTNESCKTNVHDYSDEKIRKTYTNCRPNTSYPDYATDSIIGPKTLQNLIYIQVSEWNNFLSRNAEIVNIITDDDTRPVLFETVYYINVNNGSPTPVTTDVEFIAEYIPVEAFYIDVQNTPSEYLMRAFIKRMAIFKRHTYVSGEDVVTPVDVDTWYSSISGIETGFVITRNNITTSLVDEADLLDQSRSQLGPNPFFRKSTDFAVAYGIIGIEDDYTIHSTLLAYDFLTFADESAGLINNYFWKMQSFYTELAGFDHAGTIVSFHGRALRIEASGYIFDEGTYRCIGGTNSLAQVSLITDTTAGIISIDQDYLDTLNTYTCGSCTIYDATNSSDIEEAVEGTYGNVIRLISTGKILFYTDAWTVQQLLYLGISTSGVVDEPIILTLGYYTGYTDTTLPLWFDGITATINNNITYSASQSVGTTYNHVYQFTKTGTVEIVNKTDENAGTYSWDLYYSEFYARITSKDKIQKNSDGTETILENIPVDTNSPATWDTIYLTGPDNPSTIWKYYTTYSLGPVELGSGTFGGVADYDDVFISIQPDIDIPGYTYTGSYYLTSSITITYPGGTFILQEGTAAPAFPTKVGSLVFDMHLKKWGKFKGEFKALLDYTPINNTQNTSIDYTNFGMDAAILDSDGNVKIFDGNPSEGYIRYGKIGYYRQGMTNAHEVRVDSRIPMVGTITIDSSLDGSAINTTLRSEYPTSSDISKICYPEQSGRWHTISISGIYDLTFMEFRGSIGGRR